MKAAALGLAVLAALGIGFLAGRGRAPATIPAPPPAAPPPRLPEDVRVLRAQLEDAQSQVALLRKEIAEQDRRRQAIESSRDPAPGPGKPAPPGTDVEGQDFMPERDGRVIRIYDVHALVDAAGVEAESRHTESAFTAEGIKEFIKEYVDKPVWAEEGTSIDQKGHRLFICALPQTHEKIREALKRLKIQLRVP